MPRTLIVIPCYNEERRLAVEAFARFAAEHPEIGLLFVNDGSTDATLRVLESLRDRCPERIEVLDLQPNRGKAEAVRQGFLQAMQNPEVELVGFWDADLATPLYVIPQFVSIFDDRPQVDIVTGARIQMLGRRIRRSLARHYLGRVFATVVSLLMRERVYDTQCGAKIFRVTPLLRDILAEPFLSRWIFDVEILFRYLRRRKAPPPAADTIYEFPLPEWRDVGGSKVRPHHFFVAFGDLIRIYRANK